MPKTAGGDPGGANGLPIGRGRVDVGQVEILGVAGGERIQRGRGRAHHRRENTGDDQAAKADRHFVNDVMRENFVVRGTFGAIAW